MVSVDNELVRYIRLIQPVMGRAARNIIVNADQNRIFVRERRIGQGQSGIWRNASRDRRRDRLSLPRRGSGASPGIAVSLSI